MSNGTVKPKTGNLLPAVALVLFPVRKIASIKLIFILCTTFQEHT